MPNFCAHCGAPSQGGNFCSNCGTRLVDGGSEAFVPPPPGAGGPAGAWSRAGRPSAANPFAGVPVADYVRDIAGVVLLFTSLALPWDYAEDTGGHWWTLISVLLVVVSAALPYVGKAGLVPGWGARQVRVLKLVAFVPLVVSVLVALVNELVHVTDDFEGGIGTGVAMALAGALLVVQPRAADEDPSHRDDRAWWLATRVTAVVAVALLALTWLAYLLDDAVNDGRLFDDALLLLLTVVELAALLAVVGVPVVRLLGGSDAGRRVLAVVGFTMLLIALAVEIGDGDGGFSMWPVEKWRTPLAGSFALAAAAALAVSRPAERRTGSREPLRSWVSTASLALIVSAVGLLLVAVRQLLAMFWLENYGAEVIIPVVLTVVGAGAVLFARSALRGLGRTRGTLLAVLAGVLLLGIITAAVGNDFGYPLDRVSVASWFALPLLAMGALTIPRAVRSAFGPLLADRPEGHHAASDHTASDHSAAGAGWEPGAEGHGASPAYTSGPGGADRVDEGSWSSDDTRAFDTPPAGGAVPPPPAWPPPPSYPSQSQSPSSYPDDLRDGDPRDDDPRDDDLREDDPPPGSFRP